MSRNLMLWLGMFMASCTPSGVKIGHDMDEAGVDGGGAGDRDTGMPEECLLDADGDHFGVAGVLGPCEDDSGAPLNVEPGDCDDGDPKAYPEAPIDRCDAVDNDCDGMKEEPVDEVCNGADDDCDGDVDNGVTNACGECGDAPAEMCNNVDDDCDGVTDRDLVARTGARVHTHGGTASGNTHVALVERAGGGAWFLYAAMYDGVRIAVRGLDATGAVDAKPVSAETDLTNAFYADSDGKWVVILSLKLSDAQPKNDTQWLRVQLFRASDMEFVDEVMVVSHEDNDTDRNERNDADDCDRVMPLGVSLLEDENGHVRIATVYADTVGRAEAPSSCAVDTAKTYLQVASFSPSRQWTVHPRTQLADLALSRGLVERVPCREEWVGAVAYGDTVSLARYSPTGALVESDIDALDNVGTLLALAHGHGDCESDNPPMLVGFTKSDQMGDVSATVWRQWLFDKADGAVSRLGSDLELAGVVANDVRAYPAGGRWFVNGWYEPQSLPKLMELNFAAPAAGREIPVIVEPGPTPGRVTQIAGVDVIDLGGTILAGFRNAFTGGTNLDDWRDEGDDDHAVGVTYTVGCSQ